MPPRNTQDYRVAADAAGRRAAACRRRFEALNRADAVKASDVAGAAEALAEAVRRAERARISLLAARARKQAVAAGKRAAARPVGDSGARREEIDVGQWLHSRGVPLDELFTAYLTVGGTCSKLEVDAFAHGALSIPDSEETALRHAMWEMDSF